MHSTKLAASLLVILALMWGAAPARAETVNCTPITTVPAVITVPGVYCFTKSLVTSVASGSLIEIQVNNVVLDLNGFRLGGLAAGVGTSAFGIHALDRQNITIKNGTIRGFLQGVFLQQSTSSQGHLVEDIRVDQCTYVGIQVEGSGNIVRNNQIVATGGTTIFGADAYTAGIYTVGTGARVVNNDVVTAVGVGALPGYGIVFASNGGLAVNNRVTSADVGIYFNGSGKYRDNLTFAIATPFSGGTDAGNNN